MSRRALRWMVAFSSAILTGGCLPARDNERDSANVPLAVLRVLDFGRVACVPSLGVGSASTAAVASRGECLALDASQSSDPQSAPEALTFAFARVDESGAPIPGDALEAIEPSHAPTVFLDADYRRSLPVAPAEVRFRVLVRDPSGSHADAIAKIVLTNDRPAARAIPPRVLPVGGFPWAPGEPMAVHFDASPSSDPDGDPLDYCWKFPPAAPPAGSATCTPEPDGYVCSADEADPCFTRSLDGSHQVVSASLYVRDNPDPARRLVSSRTAEIVSVREPDIWLRPQIGAASPIVRMDSQRRSRSLSYPGGASLYIGGAVPRLASVAEPNGTFPFTYQVFLESWPRPDSSGVLQPLFADLPNAEIYEDGPALAWDPVHERLWVFGLSLYADQGYVERWDVTSNYALSAPFSADTAAFGPGPLASVIPMIALDADGNAWVARDKSPTLFRTGAETGLLDTTIAPAGFQVTGLAARPENAEVWAVWAPDGVPSRAFLARYLPNGTEDVRFGLPFDGALQMAWVGPDLFWLLTAELGAVLVDAAELEETGSFDASVLQEVGGLVVDAASASSSSRFLADPLSGDAWFSNFAEAKTWRIFASGGLEEYDGALNLETIDGNGAVWYQEKNVATLDRGFTASPDAVVLTSTSPGDLFAGLDLMRGAVWFQAVTVNGVQLELLAADGTVLRREDRVVDADTGGTLTIPLLRPMRFSPDGRSAWGVAWDGVASGAAFYLDLDASPPRIRQVMDAGSVQAGLYPASTPFGILLDPAPPAAGVSRHAWIVRKVSADAVVATVSTAGTITDVYTIPAGERVVGGGMVLNGGVAASEDSLCLANADDDANENRVRVRRVHAAGTADLLGDVVYNGGSFADAISAVASATAPGVEACWVMVRETAPANVMRLRAFTGASMLKHALDVPMTTTNQHGSLYPMSPDSTWLKVGGVPAPGLFQRLDFDPDQLTAVKESISLVRDDDDAIVSP